MQNTSASFQEVVNSSSQTACLKATITYTNANGSSTTEELTTTDFYGDGIKTISDCMSSGDLTFGGTVCKELTCTLNNNNQKFHGCNFASGKMEIWSGLVLSDGTEEYVKMGVFTLEKASKPASSVKLTAYDNMLKFDKTLSNDLILSNMTAGGVVAAACSACDVELATPTFTNSATKINCGLAEDASWRDAIGFVAALAGGFARINREGKLEIVEFNISQSGAYEIAPEATRMSISVENHHSVTGIVYYGKSKAIKFGTFDYPIIVEENCLFEAIDATTLSNIISSLYDKFNGFVYCSFNLNFLGNPALDEGDYLYLPSAQGDDVYAIVGKSDFNHCGTQSLSCPEVSDYDKQYKEKENATAGEEVYKDNPNLLLVSRFNKTTLPKIAGLEYASTSNKPYLLECISSECHPSSGTFINQLLFPAQPLSAGTYTLSLYCRRRTDVATYLADGNSIFYLEVIDADKKAAEYLRNVITTSNIYYIKNNDWQWVSFTFTTKEFMQHPLIRIQGKGSFMSLTTSTIINFSFLVSKAMLESGSDFSGYEDTELQQITARYTFSTEENIEGEIMKTLAGTSQLCFAHLSNFEYVPGSQVMQYALGPSYFDVTRIYSVDNTNPNLLGTSKLQNIEMFGMDKTKTLSPYSYNSGAADNQFCKNYGLITHDTSNNFNIKCNSFKINGNDVTTS